MVAPPERNISNCERRRVSPGIGRVDAVSRILNADWTGTERNASWLGELVMVLFFSMVIDTTTDVSIVQSSSYTLLDIPEAENSWYPDP